MTLRKLTKEESTRYLGHLSLCEIDLAGQQAIANGRVLIVGAGGLGSPVAPQPTSDASKSTPQLKKWRR